MFTSFTNKHLSVFIAFVALAVFLSISFPYTIYTPIRRADVWMCIEIYYFRNPENPCAIRIYRDFLDL